MSKTRKRRLAYPTQITARVSKVTKRALENRADLLELDVAEVIRRAIEAGLPHLEPPESRTASSEDAPVTADEVGLWWDGLSQRERSRWGKRLNHIDDRTAFRGEAYRLAMEGES